APRRHPDPVNAVAGDQPLQDAGDLFLDHVGEWASGAGQGHVDDRVGLGVDGQAVDQAQVDDVNAQLRIDDIVQGLLDVRDVGRCGCRAHDGSSSVVVSGSHGWVGAVEDA